jgi:rare lipoprotein A
VPRPYRSHPADAPAPNPDQAAVLIRAALLLAVAAAALAAGCAGLPSSDEYVPGYRARGVASWYGEPFHGRATASGEIYDMNRFTAAHRVLPLGTTLIVTNLLNGRSVQVRVNDRGPFVRGRVLDLSRAAAEALDMLHSGVARVEYRLIEPAEPAPAAEYAVQVGSFQILENAERLRDRLLQRYAPVRIVGPDPALGPFRVQVGAFSGPAQAEELARRLAAEEELEGFVVSRD